MASCQRCHEDHARTTSGLIAAGVAILAGCALSGGDTTFAYSGHWKQDGERFKATLLAKRFASAPPGVFGMDVIASMTTRRLPPLSGWSNGATWNFGRAHAR
jgi:hypothetical protein